jgi:glycosyltransferase involved in cell wall biosynthesis
MSDRTVTDCVDGKPFVLFVTGKTPFGSGEVYSLTEIAAFRRAGHNVLISPRECGGKVMHGLGEDVLDVCLRMPLLDPKGIATFFAFLLRSPFRVWRYLRWCNSWSFDKREFIKALIVLPKAFRIASELKKIKITHVHSVSSTTTAVIAYVVAQEIGVPWSFSLHGWWPIMHKKKRHFEAMLQSAVFCRAISKRAAKSLADLVEPRYAEKCISLHIGVECSVVPRARKSPDGPFVVGMPAVLEPHKGHAIAIQAAELLMWKGRHFRWVFWGAGPLHEVLARDVIIRGLSQHVVFEGAVPNEELLMAYRGGEIQALAMPSVETTGRPEGIPHSLIQAMGMGIPVVATDSGGTPELVGDGGGTVIPQGDPRALAEAIEKLMDDDAHYEKQCWNALIRARDEFNERQVCEVLGRLFSLRSENIKIL